MLVVVQLQETGSSEHEMQGSLLLPGAVQGLAWLARIAEVRYHSIRARTGGSVHEYQRRQGVQRWLRQHGYPHPQRFEVCHSAMGHLLTLAQYIRRTGTSILLVTHCPHMQQEAFCELQQWRVPAFSQVESWQLATELHEHVHLLTIGEVASTQDAAGLRTHALGSWHELPRRLIPLLLQRQPMRV